MSELDRYQAMRDVGKSSAEVHAAAKADGLGPVDRVRLLRSLFDLSLGEAKRITAGEPDWLLQPQRPQAGNPVYWEGWDAIHGQYLMEGVVCDITPTEVIVEDQKRYQYRDGEYHLLGAFGGRMPIPKRYFDRPLLEQLLSNEEEMRQLSKQFRKAV